MCHEKQCSAPLFKHFNFNLVLLKSLWLKVVLKHIVVIIGIWLGNIDSAGFCQQGSMLLILKVVRKNNSGIEEIMMVPILETNSK